MLHMVKSGESIVYHTGLLANDRSLGFTHLKRSDRMELNQLASDLYNAAMRGEGWLTQRRIERNVYAYIFTKK